MKRAAAAFGYLAALLLVGFFVLAVMAVWNDASRFWGLGFLALAAAFVAAIVAVVLASIATSKEQP